MSEFCAKCGAPAPSNAAFCARCGTAFVENVAKLEPFDPAKYADLLDFSDAANDDWADDAAPEIPTNPLSAFRICVSPRKYVGFRGRASRSEFWFWTAAVGAINVVWAGAAVVVCALSGVFLFAGIVGVAFLVAWLGANLLLTPPSLAVLTRRLHDRGVAARRFFAPTLVAAAVWLGAVWALSEGVASSPILRALAGYTPLVLVGIGIGLFVECVLPGKPEANRFGVAPRRD